MTLTSNLSDKTVWIDKYYDSHDLLEAQVYSRLGSAALIPLTFFSTIFDTIIGLGITLESLLALRKNDEINNFAASHLEINDLVLSLPFSTLIRLINPQAVFELSTDAISGFGIKYLQTKALEFKRAGGWHAHVVTRLIFGTILPLTILANRVVDLAISILFVPLAVITLGLFENINNIAIRSLATPGIVGELTYCSLVVLNPWELK